jgi:hypothetical protein
MSLLKADRCFYCNKEYFCLQKNLCFVWFAKPEELQQVVGMNWDINKMNPFQMIFTVNCFDVLFNS